MHAGLSSSRQQRGATHERPSSSKQRAQRTKQRQATAQSNAQTTEQQQATRTTAGSSAEQRTNDRATCTKADNCREHGPGRVKSSLRRKRKHKPETDLTSAPNNEFLILTCFTFLDLRSSVTKQFCILESREPNNACIPFLDSLGI